MTTERKIYSLTQLNRSLEKHFWENFGNRSFWVSAEIIKVNEKSGHFYFELADSREGQTTARSTATLWSTAFAAIDQRIGRSELEQLLKPGNKVLFSIVIEFHAIYGLKLKITDIDPAYSYGEIERKRQEVISRLKKEGLFDLQRKLKLPLIIKRIALIGSPDTSGFRDFKNELLNNHDFNKFKIKVFPVRVQGEHAAFEIAKAVREAALYDVDAVVVLRGGGSKMDLAIFDDYALSKAICEIKKPVLTGIGHETDRVVADMVAHTFFITPTAVARHIHYAISSFKEIMREMHDKTMQLSQQLLSAEKGTFNHVNNYLVYHSRALLHFWRSKFQERAHELGNHSTRYIYRANDELKTISHELQSMLGENVRQQRNILERELNAVSYNAENILYSSGSYEIPGIMEKINVQGLNMIQQSRINLEHTVGLLELLNPNKILQSGYTISTIDDVDVMRYEGEMTGKELKTLTVDRLIMSEIKKIIKLENGNKNNNNL
ncbi:MAG: exodeoxyribonuclease VII large subunit [Brumimicrobium sp.]|nr:exodeoxyribonuclease VII large subunit [Brumimicrobium sp.]